MSGICTISASKRLLLFALSSHQFLHPLSRSVSDIQAAKTVMALLQWASCPGDCRATEEMQGSQGSCRNSTRLKHSEYSRGRQNILHASKVGNSQGSPSLCPPHRFWNTSQLEGKWDGEGEGLRAYLRKNCSSA